MANFPKPKANLSLLISLFLFFFSQTISSLPRPSGLLSPQHAPRFLGKISHSNNTGRLGAPRYRYETRYFDQNLDHFSFSDLPMFRQRYLINTEYWAGPDKLGPIFLYCGNEGDIEWFAANTGFVWELAPRFRAMIIFPEHRYYGESMPYGSWDEAYKNASTLAHLTAEQALADFAVLITELKRNFSAQACPVVLFGGSYGGSEIITTSMLNSVGSMDAAEVSPYCHWALASSAPVLQFEDIVPPETFYDIVSNDFRRESISCFNTIKDSWDVIESEGQKTNGLSYLTETFAFVDYPYPADFLMPMPANPIKEVCKKIDNCPDGTSIIQRIFEGVSVYYNYTGKVNCFNLEDDPHGMNGWNWQACTEMVMPTSSSKSASMFPAYDYNYTSDEEWCWENYRVKPRPTWISTEFGGHDMVFSSQLINLFLAYSVSYEGIQACPEKVWNVLEDISETIVALVTEKGAHHLDLRPATAEDPDWLVEQRAAEAKLIQGWLDEYFERKRRVFDM
ncbi:Lysosomal Pro-X carboxypeptidase [Sesamum angolense]|uniref:Lysosomal Pro-X carboxypeptidase n=1 Tax=Sesamum angolense TaxID=2727404 RepID=A0AAE1XEP5_9LAMI|nr:Lysosomal Pro-X carboxypeptidase [Sesamum angolense]